MNLKAHSHRPKFHHSTLLSTPSIPRSQAPKRRSNRMSLNASVGLSGEDRQKCTFTMPARATNLNRHGAAVALNRDLAIGTVVVVKNKRGTELSARVVAQLAAMKGVTTYGIEFVDQDDRTKNFWGISFPTNAS